MRIVEILIEYASHTLDRPFSYLYDGNKKLGPGFRVLVNFNRRPLVGYVLSIKETTLTQDELEEQSGYRLEDIEDVIDEAPLLNQDLFDLAKRVSQYYLAPFISVLQAMLPPSLSPRKSSLRAPKIAYEQYLTINRYSEIDLTDKQIEILRLVKKEGQILKKEVGSPSVVEKLLNRELIKIVKVEKRRLSIPDYKEQKPPLLTEDQKKVIDEFNGSGDSVFLLQGVTGSGKTEVYLTLCEKELEKGKSVLFLVPEISLTPMMMEYFIRRFRHQVAILHSELTPAEKYDEYRKIACGEAKVVIGARSAIFAPLENIGLIILDEEHVESYKQDSIPFYHAREVAIMRGEMHSAKVLLGSATPSLESRARAKNGVYHLLRLDRRINEQKLPATKIINLADYHNINRDSYIFSLTLRYELDKVLKAGQQAILLINRRGFSTSISCRSCGYVFRCPTCGIALTYHKTDNMLKCHHCDYVQVMSETCPECGSKYLMKTGFGTERIEEEVHRLFPEARTLRLDSDSAKVRTKIPSIIESFRKKEADILIGTQMIAKGHDFPDVTLVGIVLADIGLSMPSFRSSERVFQLITQAVGRSGRSDKVGKAIIQTYNPSHYAITYGARQDYEGFFLKEMGMRKLQNYPPYYFLASITVSGKKEETVITQTYNAVDYLNGELGEKANILGPTTPYIAKERQLFLRTILVKYRDYITVQETLLKLIGIFAKKSTVDIGVNIDPYNF
ncbi:MAG TPA: primosomal protein N' [Bacilli bacterium]|nr:primosomal protein N' [Bacilli bacterium]HQA55954.1 primosomal protein N' [Bacilli bacterium]